MLDNRVEQIECLRESEACREQMYRLQNLNNTLINVLRTVIFLFMNPYGAHHTQRKLYVYEELEKLLSNTPKRQDEHLFLLWLKK